MLRVAIVSIAGLLALAGPASAQTGPYSVTGGTTIPPRVTHVELENTLVTSYRVHAPGTQVGSEG